MADLWVAPTVDQMAAEMVHHLVARKVVLKVELWVRLSDRQQEFSSFDGRGYQCSQDCHRVKIPQSNSGLKCSKK